MAKTDWEEWAGDRLLSAREILAPEGPIPLAPSTWWTGVRDGRYPKGKKLAPRKTVWRASDIRRLIERGIE